MTDPTGKQIEVDPITLSVVRGILETTQREMTLSLEKTARSSSSTWHMIIRRRSSITGPR
ncbi:hypothetical protein [Gemmobacter sp. 24YEA27]|uniref:hypothetical protein n=1 Tax=Gemmobacter sp. 24YEA27 TaxID=3040672 RepID=UPI0024B37215|nr:hypothetical protein [Gemmobacter sp. 24YEA27]